ncbi:N-lysine methyltransferase KMT5A-A isoform X1 [Anguilla rostrata]|uniref:N-lysine methyltransferase KMT5A-A isoform X1 n=2 Tax=Anguilla rostrata TaxID=7938 RepID=UPI0030D51CE1
MPQGKNAVPTATKSKPEDATCTEEKGIKEHKPEMNGDVACSRQPASPNFKSLDKQHSPHHDENHGKRTAHGDKMMYGKAVRLNIMNSDGGLPRGAEGRLGPSCVPGEQGRQPRCTEAYLRGPADPTADSNGTSRVRGHKRQTCCRKAKVTKSTLRTAEYRNSQNRKLTEFYPIRRSSRKCNAELKCEEKKHIDELLSSGTEEGMKVQHIEGKGRGVFATRSFRKGQFVVEYHGDLLQITDAKKREAKYAQDPSTGCYMYYFQYQSKTYCVDATRESERLGRLINHSKNGNCQTKLHDVKGKPHLILVASRDIEEGEELLYDYGDRSKASIAAHPWLKH